METERAKKLAYVIGFFLLALGITEIVAIKFSKKIEKNAYPLLVIDDSFVSESLNEIAFFKCVSIDSAGIPPMDIKEILRGFQATEKKRIIRPDKEQNRCFQYLEIINKSHSQTEFVWSV
jgi:hypothetical protein